MSCKPKDGKGVKTTLRIPDMLAPTTWFEDAGAHHTLWDVADQGFTVRGSALPEGSHSRVAFLFGERVSVTVPARAGFFTADGGQTFSVVGREGHELMRIVLDLSRQELMDWLAVAPTPPLLM